MNLIFYIIQIALNFKIKIIILLFLLLYIAIIIGNSDAINLIKRKIIKSTDLYLQAHLNATIIQNRGNFTPPISPNINNLVNQSSRARGYSSDGMFPLKAGWLLKKRDILNGCCC